MVNADAGRNARPDANEDERVAACCSQRTLERVGAIGLLARCREAMVSRQIRRRRPSTRALPFAVAIAAAMLTASPAVAQGSDSTGGYRLPEPDLRLVPGMIVHVAAPSVGQLEAVLVQAAGREIVVRDSGSERTVRLEAGDSLWVLGHSAARGANVGATVGLVLTGAAVALFYATCRSGTDDPCTGQLGFIPLGVVLGGTGALLGAAVGRLVPRWELRWP